MSENHFGISCALILHGEDMKLAIPVWNDRVSPVFDTATQILIVEVEKGQILTRQIYKIDQIPGFQRGEWLARAGVKTVVCGAVSNSQEAVLRAAGMDVIPWIGGDIEDVIFAYCTGGLDRGDFRLPGFDNGHRRRRRGRRVRSSKSNSSKQFRYRGR